MAKSEILMPTQNGRNGIVIPSEQRRDIDIFTMLSKAQEEFNCSNGAPQAPKNFPAKQQQQHLPQQFANMRIAQQPPPQISQQPPQLKQLQHMNVANFFAAAQQPNGNGSMGDAAIFAKPGVKQQQPPVHTVDEIEKQHRVSASPPLKTG